MNSSSHIIAAKRSAVVPRNGSLSTLQLHELASPVMRALLHSAGIADTDVNQLIVGNALGGGGNPARLISLAAGLNENVSGISIDQQCTSGLDAMMLADALIRSKQASIVIAGGVESYSKRPQRYQHNSATGEYEFYSQPAFTPWPNRDPGMAEAANTIAEQLGISAEKQNQWAVDSHAKAMKFRAQSEKEIVRINDVTEDAFTRPLSLRTCGRAKKIIGTINSANTAVEADGAAFCLLVSDDVAKKLAKPSLRIEGSVSMGANPELPGLAPVQAINTLLSRQGLSVSDIQFFEIMEAYAAQAIAVIDECQLPEERCNRHGGALARGHPIGASGAVLVTRLFTDMLETRLSGKWSDSLSEQFSESKSALGLAAIAGAGGIASALLLQAS